MRRTPLPDGGDWMHFESARQEHGRIDLFQLHRIDPKVPLADQAGTLLKLQREGQIRNVGLLEVTVGEIERVRRITTSPTAIPRPC